MKINPLHFLVTIIFFTVSAVFAQNTTANPAKDATKDVKFHLSFVAGKTTYRIGEPIKLRLSYTSDQPDYTVETYYSPRFDDVIISPVDGVYDWLNRLNRLYSYDDVSATRKLSQTPVNIDLTINNLVRFDKPGKYKVKVITKRVRPSRKDSSLYTHPVPLLSNELEFEVKEMSQAEEKAELKRITALMDAAKTLNQHGAIKRELDYLTGDFSTVEKVNRFLNPPLFNRVYWLDTGIGLNIARNKKLAVELLEAVLRDPNREIKQDLIYTLVRLRLLMEDEQQPSQATNSNQLEKERSPRSAEISQAYYAELLESLPNRSGRNQIITAYRIFTALPKNDSSSAAYIKTKAFLLEKFDELNNYEQSDLLEYNWDKIKTPSLIPSLEKILSNKEPESAWNNRANAFKRLIELDSKRARIHVINEIRDPDSLMKPDILKTLNDKLLPEADDELLKQITNLAATTDRRMQLNRQFKITLAARYATGKIYKEMSDIYKKYGVNWSIEQSGPLLSYLLRHNEKETIPLIEEKLLKFGEKSGFTVFSSLTGIHAPEGLQKILRKRLESDEPEILGTASYYLSSRYPTKENRKLIEKRHERWWKEWSPRKAELNDPKADGNIKKQVWAQREMLGSLLRTPLWASSPKEIYQLKLKCLTEECRRNFSSRP